ncbi:RICIN domain-containing protein [Arthrobacter sp. B2a2-09]|uniref:RICIN domain-containing protein n=1 Tax=Arthrobacter sp. B2a2-09 TaxID=2952822 RepID=UPI0022CD46FC|nr:RICIN domain-containing protein [Arthrobacter sp. B2a2-09]MCZ9881688.1 RICIN domain-containing protein [Arthrobacter sp. B2a2-09]
MRSLPVGRNRALGVIVAAAVLGGCFVAANPAVAATGTNFWVDPVNGNDANPGSSSTQAFRTLGQAQTAVRSVNSSMSGDIVVNLEGGTYSQTSTLSLTNLDSGTNGHTVSWQAVPGQTPVVSGAQAITGWTSAGGGVYKASVGSLDFRQLYVNGARSTRARFPDNGSWFQITGSDATAQTVTVPAASVSSWTSGAPEMVLETQWGESYLRVKNIAVNGGTATVSFQSTESNILFQRPWPMLANGSPFHWEGALAFVTQPGEWYLDNAAGTVYYMPRAGENISNATITAPVAQTVLDVSGSDLDHQATNVTFSGITFTGTTWTRPTTSGYLNAQGGLYNLSANTQNQQYVGRPPAAVHVSDATNIQFLGDKFTNIGSTALDFDHGSHAGVATGNVISGISGNGIMIGKFSDPNVEYHSLYNPPTTPAGEDVREVAKGQVITDNLITRIGLDYYGTAAVNAGWVNSTVIEHNEISDTPWAGITVGWGWQHTAGAAGNNTVTNNEISNVVNRLCDTGAIYHLSVDPGSTYSNNYIHDVHRSAAACGSPVSGLYLDEGSDQLSVLNNVVSNVDQTLNQNQNGSGVTVSGTASTGKSVIQAAGLEPAYQSLRNAVDLAQGHPASASSTYSSSTTANYAVDGNGSTGWSASATDTNAWWQVDLGTSTSVAQVQVVARQDLDQAQTRTGFQVELSNDPTFASFTTAARETSSIPDAGTASFNVFSTAAYRYVRVQKTDGNYFFIADVRVLGNPIATGAGFVDPGTNPTTYYTLTNVNSGLVADINGFSTSDGTVLQQYTPNGGTNQQWQIKPVGGNLFQIINRNSGKPLDVTWASPWHGATVEQNSANGGNHQLWYFQSGPNGSFSISNFNSGQVMEVGANSTGVGAGVDQFIPVNQANQNWTLTPVN